MGTSASRRDFLRSALGAAAAAAGTVGASTKVAAAVNKRDAVMALLE